MTVRVVSNDGSVWRSSSLSIILLSLAVLFMLTVPLLPGFSEAGACTKGVNCYCDQVQGGNLNDPSILLCEDFEAPTLRAVTPVGGGAPYWGPPFDDSGQVGNRGGNGYWARTYNNGTDGSLWKLGSPTSPAFGRSCGFALCSGTGLWDPSDRWQANSFARAAILGDSDFSVEIPSVTRPSGKAGGGSGAFDGAASLAHRVMPGNNAGIIGYKSFGGARRTFGITMAVAYANNSDASGIWAAPWKHNEWHAAGTGGGGDGLFMFHNQGFRSSQSPFRYMFTFSLASLGLGGGDTQAACSSKLAAATKTTGEFFCDAGGNFNYAADSRVYNRTVDWPDGTWGCVRGYYQNMGTTNSSIQLWFTGQAGVEKKILDISNMDLTGQSAKNGYDQLLWNNYANVNQSGGGVPTNQTTFRYEDNVHIRAAAPVSCAQIGFSTSTSTSTSGPLPVAPSPPTGVQMR